VFVNQNTVKFGHQTSKDGSLKTIDPNELKIPNIVTKLFMVLYNVSELSRMVVEGLMKLAI
jgi:hypothetical protein